MYRGRRVISSLDATLNLYFRSTTRNWLSTQPLPSEADVIVIGGGSIGCSTLYHLAKLGVKNAILLERDKLTSGTTWHTAGLLWRLRPYDIDIQLIDRTWRLNREILPEETGMSTGWVQNGGLFIASTKERLDEYKRLMTLGKFFGIESHVLSPEETKKLYPLMNVKDVYGTLYSPGDGTLDPSGWCSSLVRAAQKYGAKVFEQCRVVNVLTAKDDYGHTRVRGVETNRGIVYAKAVVNCAGAWGPKLAAKVGVHVPTVAMKHAYVISERIDGIQNTPNVRDHDSSIYLRLQGDALAIGGYEHNPYFWEDPVDDFSFQLFDLDWDHFSQHINGAVNRVPVLKQTGIKSQVCGPMSFTPDHKPLMGESNEIRGFYLGCGMDTGMMMGGGFGQQLALWVVNGRPDLHMYRFDIRRFAPQQTVNKRWCLERCHENHVTMYRTVFPNDEYLSGRNLRKTPFNKTLLDKGAVFQERHGWERVGWFATDGKKSPVLPYDWYGAYPHTPAHKDYLYPERIRGDYSFDFPKHHNVIKEECMACRNKAAVFDMSYFGKYYISGPDAQKAMDWIFSADVRRPAGTTVYTCMLNAKGGVEADLTVSVVASGTGSSCDPKFGNDVGFYIAAGGGSATHALKHIETVLQDMKFNVKLENRTEEMGMLSVQGPKSREILQQIVDIDLSDAAFPFSAHRLAKVAGHHCRMLRLSFVGELGFELHIPHDSCLSVYDALFEAGEKHGLINAGYRAIDSLSIEKGYRYWDSDLRLDDSPLEASMAYTCKLKTDVSFLGRTALEQQKKDGLKKRLVCLTVDSKTPLWSLEAIMRDGVPVGFVRRADYGFFLQKAIAYGYVSRPDKKPVTNDWITSGSYVLEAMGKQHPATVHLKSPFDPDNQRIKGHY